MTPTDEAGLRVEEAYQRVGGHFNDLRLAIHKWELALAALHAARHQEDLPPDDEE